MKTNLGKKKSVLGTVAGIVVALLIYFLNGGKLPDKEVQPSASEDVSTVSVQEVLPPSSTVPPVSEAPAVTPVAVTQPKKTATPANAEAPSKKSAAPKAPAPQVKESRARAHWHHSNLQRHWEKHCAEFPECADAEAYGAAAAALADNPPEGTLRKTTAEGDQMFYHPPSNRFLVMTADGTIKTCFKPDQGINYWRRQ